MYCSTDDKELSYLSLIFHALRCAEVKEPQFFSNNSNSLLFRLLVPDIQPNNFQGIYVLLS